MGGSWYSGSQMWAPHTLPMHRIFQVTGPCVSEWVLNFLFQTSVISSRVYRVHDTSTSGFGGVDLKHSQANMLGANVALTAGEAGCDLIGGPIWGFTWVQHSTFPADFSCASKLGASFPAQRHLVAFSLVMTGTQNLGTAASHAENGKRVENHSFLKKTSVTNPGRSEPDSVSAWKGAPEAQKWEAGPTSSAWRVGWTESCGARQSWAWTQILPLSSLLTFLRQATSLKLCFLAYKVETGKLLHWIVQKIRWGTGTYSRGFCPFLPLM